MTVNAYSKWLPAVALSALLVGGCGGGSSDGGSAAGKGDWQKKHGAAATAVSADVDAANAALDKGDRPLILSSCNQLQEDLADARRGLPVPDPTVNDSLRAGLDAVGTAVPTCLEGARVANQASVTEQAQREMKAARTKMDDANKAIADWK